MKLYEIAEEVRLLQRMMETEDVDEESFASALDRLNIQLEAKAANIGLLVKELRADIEARKEAIDQLKRSNSTDEGRIAWLTGYLKKNLADPVKTPLVSVSFRAGVESVRIDDETVIPKRYMKTTSTPMKSEIRAALKEGEFVPGATLVRGEQSLQIK